MPHGKEIPHGSEAHARQGTTRMAKGFAVQFGYAHDKEVFAVGLFTEQSLS
jgi:hypothetical protein